MGQIDHRRYVRMGTVFPVEFAVVGASGENSPENLLQGFTCNVSEGGMCIEFKTFGKAVEEKLQGSAVLLNLVINPSFSRNPIHAKARIVWLKKEESSQAKYLIGIVYEAIDAAERKRLIGYARRMRLVPRLTAALGLVLLVLLTAVALHNRALIHENLTLVSELREGAAKKSAVAGELLSLESSRRLREEELEKLRLENGRLEQAIVDMNKEVSVKVNYENELVKSHEREALVRAQLEKIRSDQEALRQSYQALEKTGRKASDLTLRWMGQWLKAHQNLKTGLVASYEGDPALENVAFTYDQSLAAQAMLLTGETERMSAILSFYETRAQNQNGAFFNAYDTVSGQPSEMEVRTGPNLWLGIAALKASNEMGDKRFLLLARRVGVWAISLQDAEGGLPGGPGITWYGTEHNLDAYAFFGMLGRATGDEKFLQAQTRVLGWLKKYAYSNPRAGSVNRGKGDATIATDTFAWSVASLGPATLEAMGFDPEAILVFAEEHCEVTVPFRDAAGKSIEVRGFDFSKAQNTARGGVVSTEWTAQMIVSYRVLAKHFKETGNLEKAQRYLEKADFYLNELQKMLIASPSRTGQGRGCLPYASADNVDTGHGWRTPVGSRTGSVAGTAYGLFAWKGYNPFEGKEQKGEKNAGI